MIVATMRHRPTNPSCADPNRRATTGPRSEGDLMFAAFRSQATFAKVCVVLVFALALTSGTAYAGGKIRSKDIVNGQVKTVDLANNGVTTGKILDGTITSADLGASSVNSGTVVNESLTSSDLATDSVQASEIADNSIDGGEIVDNSLGTADIATGGVGSSEVADSSLTGADVAANSLTTADLRGTDANGGISLGSGAVAVGRCNFYGISVPGAAVGEVVIISARATLPTGVLLYGVGVPSTDTVTMAACNFTGGTFPALSSFPIRTVTFG